MKNTMKLAGIIALVAVIGLAMAACTVNLPGESTGGDGGSGGGGSTTTRVSGTYSATYEGITASVTFSGSNFTLSVPGQSLSGTYSISGNTVNLRYEGELIYYFTIVDSNTLKDGDGYIWRK